MVVVSYCDEITRKKKWVEESAAIKAELKKYPSLEKAIDFSRYNDNTYGNENAILSLIINQSHLTLQMLEELLSNLTSPLHTDDRLTIINRLNNTKSPNDILSVITELEILTTIAQKIGFGNLKYNPLLNTENHADILAKLTDKSVYIEIFNSIRGTPEVNIQLIMQDSLDYLLTKLNKPCCLDLQIDTAKLPTQIVNSAKRIDVENSKNKLRFEVDALRFDLLPNQLGSLALRAIIDYLEESQYIKANNWSFRPTALFKEETNETNIWQGSLSLESVRKIELLYSILCFPSEGKSAQMQEIGEFPSEALSLEINSFINRFIRNLKRKVVKQTYPDFPNIIISQWHHWIQVTSYYQEIINSLANKIQNEIFDLPESNVLSGVAIFTTICPVDFGKAVYIANEKANATSKLTQEDIFRLGFNGINYV